MQGGLQACTYNNAPSPAQSAVTGTSPAATTQTDLVQEYHMRGSFTGPLASTAGNITFAGLVRDLAIWR